MKSSRRFPWLRLLAICTAICVASSSPARGVEEGVLLIQIRLALEDTKTEILVEDGKGKLVRLDKASSKEVLEGTKHYISDLTLKDSKLVKVVFKRRLGEAPKKPE